MVPKVLLFDLDNTIWDFRRSSQISLQRVYERYVEPQGIAFAEWQARYLYHNDFLWEAYQRGGHTAADAGVPKPAREIFNLACRRAGVLPEEAAYVGDDYHSDVVGAKSAGLTSIWYNPASALPPVSATLPDYEIGSFEQLIDIFITR